MRYFGRSNCSYMEVDQNLLSYSLFEQFISYPLKGFVNQLNTLYVLTAVYPYIVQYLIRVIKPIKYSTSNFIEFSFLVCNEKNLKKNYQNSMLR